MRYRWPAETVLREVVLEPEERACAVCGEQMHICDHRGHKIFTLRGPVQIVSKLCHCPDAACAGHYGTVSPDAELALAPPGLTMAAGLREIRGSLQHNLDAEKGVVRRSNCAASPAALTAAWPKSERHRHDSNRVSRTCAR